MVPSVCVADVPDHRAQSRLTRKTASTSRAMVMSTKTINGATTNTTKCCAPGGASRYQVRALRYRLIRSTTPHPSLDGMSGPERAVNPGQERPPGQHHAGPDAATL